MSTKLCAFSTSNDAYALKAAVSLLSIRNQNQNIDLFLIGRNFSENTKNYLNKVKIKYIEIDLKSYFNKSWDYPIECYYIFAGPELLLSYGFSYSIYIDGDVYCNSSPNYDLNEIKYFAGVYNGTVSQILGSDFNIAKKTWNNISENTLRLQTGVLYFNNISMKKIKFLSLISELYLKSQKLNIPRKGDDSLFALFQSIFTQYEYKNIDRNFNYIESDTESDNRKINLIYLSKIKFYHFTNISHKPWELNEKSINRRNRIMKKKWMKVAKSNLEKNDFSLMII